jgi:hypothetical protein
MPRIILLCRHCEAQIGLEPPFENISDSVECPGCKKPVPVRFDSSLLTRKTVRHCVACGHETLYIQKDFNRNLGVAIVAVGSLISLYFFANSRPLAGMLALAASALVDLVIYSMVGDVTVCYACHTVYRGFEKNPEHGPFELKDLQKFGGRDPRF